MIAPGAIGTYFPSKKMTFEKIVKLRVHLIRP